MNETYEYSDRRYLNPDVDKNERLAFIDTLRRTEADAMAKNAADTHALGSDLESIKGGLDGSAGVWKNRFVAPQTNVTVAELRAAAQSSALNTALKNLQGQYKKAYNDAYYAAMRRSDKKGGGNGGGGGNKIEGNVLFNSTDPSAADNAQGLRTDKGIISQQQLNFAREKIEDWHDYRNGFHPIRDAYNWISWGSDNDGTIYETKTPEEYLRALGFGDDVISEAMKGY